MPELFEDATGQYTNETILQGIQNHTSISFGMGGLGGFNCGDIDLSNLPDYIKEAIAAIPDSDHKVWTEEKYGNSHGPIAVEWAQHLSSFGLSGRVIVAILAVAWTECGWRPKGNPNKKELSGGWSNCGEGTIGFTHWKTKQKWIKMFNADSRSTMKLPEEEGAYINGPHISDLDMRHHMLMTVLFYNNIISQYGNADMGTLVAELFLEKAGRGFGKSGTSVDRAYQAAEVYSRSNGTKYNTVCCNYKSVPHIGAYLQKCGAVQFAQPGTFGPGMPVGNISLGAPNANGISVLNESRNVRQRHGANYIVIHYTAGPSSKPGSWQQTHHTLIQRGYSTDFMVDDSTIVQWAGNLDACASTAIGSHTANGTSRGVGCSNRNSFSIETCSNIDRNRYKGGKLIPNANYWYFTQATLNNLAHLCRYLMKRYNIPKSHIIRHFDVSGKECPGIIGWNTGHGNNENTFLAFVNSL